MVDRKQIPGDEPVIRRVPAATAPPEPQARPAKARMKPERRKITPEDVEAAFVRRRAERAERRANRPVREMGKVLRIATASVLGAGIIGCALAMNHEDTEHTATVRVNDNKIAALSGALEELAPKTGEEADTAGNMAEDIAGAQRRSDELAAAQQQFAVIFHARNTETSANDGTPGAAALASLEQRRKIAGFFAPESLVLTDEQAYSFRTERLLEPGRIDPRQPWYTRYEDGGQLASAPDRYLWKAVSVTVSGTPGVMDVVWTNTDTESGDLLAWATARYSAETDTFNTLRVNTTTRGDSNTLKAGGAQAAPSGEGTA